MGRRRIIWIGAGLAAFAVGFVAVTIASYWPYVEEAVAPERSPLTWLSSALIAAGAAVCLSLAMRSGRPWRFGAIAAGLAFMALDERFMFHERLKDLILWRAYDGDLGAMGVVGDLPMLAYAAGGAAVLVLLWRVVATRTARILLATAIGLGAVCVGLDLAFGGGWPQVIEELTEIVAEGVLLVALLSIQEG